MVELSKEILLLHDIMQKQHFSVARVVKLIKDICEGLETSVDEEERNFLKLKISVYLFLNVIHHESDTEQFAFCPINHYVALDWNSFFEICVKSTICDSLFTILTLFPKTILFALIEKLSQEMSSNKYFNDCIAIMCIFFSFLLQQTDPYLVGEFEKILENYFISKTFDAPPVHEYHVDAVQQAILILENLTSIQTNNAAKVDILQLQKLKHLSMVNSSNFNEIFSSLDKSKSTSYFPVIKKKSVSTEKGVYHKLTLLTLEMSNRIKTIAKSEKMEQKYRNLLISYAEKLQNINKFYPKYPILEDQKDENIVWDVKSALFCATSLLPKYDSAAEFLLQRLKENLSPENVLTFGNELSTVPECMATSRHVVSLCEIISTLAKQYQPAEHNMCFKCAFEWLIFVFKILPFKSKENLLKQRCSGDLLCYSDSLLNDSGIDFYQKVNLVFNTLTKLIIFTEFQNFLHSVSEVAFIDPQLTIQNIVNQIAYHREHHDLVVKLFQSLPCLAVMEDAEKQNRLVACLCQKIKESGTEDTSNSICEFITLLLADVTNDHSLYYSEQLISSILNILTKWNICNSTDQIISVSFSFHALKCLSNTLAYIPLFDLFAIVHSLACIVDETSTVLPDYSYGQVKLLLKDIVEILSQKVSANNVDTKVASDWLKNASSYFQWTTKLYLKPVFRNFNLSLPLSLKTVCDIPEDMSVCFDAEYEEGTGLTAWLQCFLIDPCLFPVSLLCIQDMSLEDQRWFKHGMVVALSQVLPFSIEDDWHTVLEAMKVLINHNYMYIKFPLNRVIIPPLLNLKKFSISLLIAELLHCVNAILSSRCCSSWMHSSLWTRYTRCYALSIKQMMLDPADVHVSVDEIQEQLFFVSQLFIYSCDFLILLEGINNYENFCDSIHVLLLDLLTIFCEIHNVNSNTSSTVTKFWMHDLITLKSCMASSISDLKCNQTKTALSKKLVSLT